MAAVPRLLANVSDLCAQKILVAAKAAGVEMVVEAPKAGQVVPELLSRGRTIAHTNAIMRYIGRLSDASDLYGSSFFESAQVDSWLDWSELELGTDAEENKVMQAVEVLEKHLEKRTFIVGQRFTLADASISCSLRYFQQSTKLGSLPQHSQRWLGTCVEKPCFGGLPKAAPTAGASPGKKTSSPAVAVPSGASASTVGDEKPHGSIGRLAEAAGSVTAHYSSAVGGRTRVARILGAADGGVSLCGEKVTICGWARTFREANKGQLMFAEINDGSCPMSIQCVIASSTPGFSTLAGKVGAGASVKCTGKLVESPGKGQKVELLLDNAEDEVFLFGGVDAKAYPLPKGNVSKERLREIAHLRPRSQFISSVARVRSSLAMATHMFFRERGFQYVHTPLITAADCEGAGEMFQVTTMMKDAEQKGLPMKDNKIDYTKDFFGKPSFLTVSGQLSVENYCCALSNVYTFGPTFRAEDSHTSRHLAEFWMIEPELAFADIFDDMQCAEDYMKFCVTYVLEQNKADLEWFDGNVEKGLVARLQKLLEQPFGRVTYTEAIEILIKESKKAKFQVPVEWGMDLNSEHERYLVEKVTMKPTVVYNYPKDIKAFYMRLNEDDKTVAAMDILVPGIGEVIGGSQREERLDVLERRLSEMELDPQDYWWYMDLRRYGSVPHSGFGLGFERMIMLCTGVDNIRDTIPFPRYPGHADF